MHPAVGDDERPTVGHRRDQFLRRVLVEDDDDRSTHIRNGLTEYYAEELAGHGYAGSRDELLEVMSIDIELNAQGLEFWLEKRKQ